jgi:hypothetical protein
MKKVKVAAALVLTALSMSTFAGTTNQDIDVSATLTTHCRSTAGGNLTLAITYTAFDAGTSATAPVTFECTRGLAAPSITFDVTTSTVAGLQYTLSAPAAGGNSAGTAASPLTIGTPATYNYTVTATVPGSQAGDASAATSEVRQMTINF